MLNVILVAVLTLLISWISGWILVDPTNTFLSSILTKDKIEGETIVVTLKDKVYNRLGVEIGGENFISKMFECPICVGSYFGLATSIIGNILFSSYLGISSMILLIISMYLGSVFLHYLVLNYLNKNKEI